MLLHCFSCQKKRIKINESKFVVALRGGQSTIAHNNQQQICRNDGGGIIQDARPDGEVRRAQLH